MNSGTHGPVQSNSLVHHAYDILMCGIQENNCAGEIVYSNPAHHGMLRYEIGELYGKKIWELPASEEEQTSLHEYFKVLVEEQPEPVPYVVGCRRKDGTVVELQIDWNYIKHPNGELVGFLSAITDVSDNRIVKGELRHSAESLSALVDVSRSLSSSLNLQNVLQSAVDGIVRIAGLDTAAVYLLEGENLDLRATAPALPDGFPDSLRRAPITDHPHIRRTVQSRKPALIADLLNEELTPAEAEAVNVRNLRTALYVPLILDERVLGAFIVASVAEPVDLSGNVVTLTTALSQLSALAVKNAQLYNDAHRTSQKLETALSERLKAESERNAMHDQLIHAQKMESIGRLAGGVAHDFNNMLSVILGHADLALLDLSPSEPFYEVLTQIRSAAERSADLTNQLLAFARKQTIRPKILNLNDVIGPTTNMLRRMIGEDIELAWMPGEDLGLVEIDPAQIDQILANLCVNARDAISGVGKITIETNNAVFDEQYCDDHPGYNPGSYVVISVSDDGCGMDSETRASIFEPFFSTKMAGEGTGLGLSTVYGIVRQNRGFINVYSELDQGTTFNIYLMRDMDGSAAKEVYAVPDTPEHGSETILIVEDEAMILKLCQRMLEAIGYKVLAANSPSQALLIAEEWQGSVDLLLSDVIMPEMTGPELAVKLQRLRSELKVLYMSGYTENVIVHHGIMDSSVVLISKPFSQQELSVKVREAIER